MFSTFKMSQFGVAVIALACLLTASSRSRGDDSTPAAPSISGKVVDSSGNGVSGVSVKLFNAPAGKNKKAAAALDNLDETNVLLAADTAKQKRVALKEAVSGSDGSFSFTDVAPGDYLLVAVSKATKTTARLRVTVKTGDNTPVTLTLAPRKAGKKPAST